MFLLLAVHLLCVNLAGGGPLLLVWLEWRAHSDDALAEQLAVSLAWWSVAALLAGSAVGLVIGLAFWSEQYAHGLEILWPKLRWGLAELLFSLVLMVGVAVWWRRPRLRGSLRVVRGFVSFLASTNLLYHFPLLLLLLMQLRTGQLAATEPITSAQFREWAFTAQVGSRALHFVVASIAVSGTFLLVWARRRVSTLGRDAEKVAIWGSRIALVATLMQVPIGIWLVTAMGSVPQAKLMGQQPLALVGLVVGLVLTLGLLQHLATTAFGDKDPRNWTRSVWMMVATVITMCLIATNV